MHLNYMNQQMISSLKTVMKPAEKPQDIHILSTLVHIYSMNIQPNHEMKFRDMYILQSITDTDQLTVVLRG